MKSKTVLDNEAVQKAFTDLRSAIYEKIEQVSIRDKDDLLELKRQLIALNSFRGYLEKAVTDGSFAASSLKHDKTIGERIAQRLRIA